MSRYSATCSRIASYRSGRFGVTWQRCGRAFVSPVARRRLSTFGTYDTLTDSRLAIEPNRRPASDAANTRSRRSCEYAFPRCHNIPASGHHPETHQSQIGGVSESPDSSQPEDALSPAVADLVPDNITLLPLPPYSPESNPMENVWDYLRGKKLSHRVWDTYDAIVRVCAEAWCFLMCDPEQIRPIATRWWACVNV
jgi:DDE superfamily endonuclease